MLDNLRLVSFANKEKIVDAQKKSLNFDWDKKENAAKVTEFADTVFELIQDTVTVNNPIPALFNRATGQAGKVIKLKRHYGGKVYERTYGEYKKESGYKTKWYTMTTSPKALHFSFATEELRNGVITIPEIVEMAASAVLYHKTTIVWKTLKDACPVGGSNITDVGTTLTQASINDLIKTYKDKWGTIGGLFGRSYLLDNIMNYSGTNSGSEGLPESIKEEWYRRGMVNIYRGVPIFGVGEILDEYYNTVAMDTSTAFLVGANKEFNRYVEVAPLTQRNEVIMSDNKWHLYLDFEDGYAVLDNKYLHRLNAA